MKLRPLMSIFFNGVEWRVWEKHIETRKNGRVLMRKREFDGHWISWLRPALCIANGKPIAPPITRPLSRRAA